MGADVYTAATPSLAPSLSGEKATTCNGVVTPVMATHRRTRVRNRRRDEVASAAARAWLCALDGGIAATRALRHAAVTGLEGAALTSDVGVELARLTLSGPLWQPFGTQPDEAAAAALQRSVDEAMDGLAAATADPTREAARAVERVGVTAEAGLTYQRAATHALVASLWTSSGHTDTTATDAPLRIRVE